MLKQHKIGYYSFVVIFLLGIFAIGNWFERHQSLPLLLAYFSIFLCYLFLLQEKESPRFLFFIGLVSRILLFFSMPSLSDDIYRFIWDGILLNNDVHPFAELPGYYLDQSIEGADQALYDRLNSPNYFTIYPPLNQVVFWVAVMVGGSWLGITNLIRLLLVIADIGAFLALRKLLTHYRKPVHLAFFYFLNPLVIIEFTGNVHFEGLVIFFLLAGIYFFMKSKNLMAATSMGLAIGTKLLPLIYLPYLLVKGIRSKRWWVAIAAGVIGAITILPMLSTEFISGFQSSLDLYFRRFEFNASLYFMARAIGEWIYGYNNIALIGPLLSIMSLLTILMLSAIAVRNKWTIPYTLMVLLSAYLLFTTTVHPWYIVPLIALGIISGYWYPIVWSFMIFLTYFGYTESGFELPNWIVLVEYVVVLTTFVVERYFKLKKAAS